MIKALSARFPKDLGRFHMLSVKGCYERELFREWPNQDFHSLKFRKYTSCDNDPFFQNV